MDKRELEITLQMGNRKIEIGAASVYRLLSASGLEASDYSLVLSENALLDGAYVDSKKVLPRPIDISFDVSDRANTEAYRQLLISFFDPKAEGILTVRRNNVSRRIGFELAAVKMKQPHLYDILNVSLSITCPDPYFRDGSDQVRAMMDYIPLLTFPFNSYHLTGITAGLQRKISTVTINNTGDADIGIQVDFLADGGTVTNPQVMLGDGSYVRVLDVLDIDDTLKITTEPGNKRIEKNGESLFRFDRRSVFFMLPRGESTVTISADVGANNMSTSLTYSLKYLGV